MPAALRPQVSRDRLAAFFGRDGFKPAPGDGDFRRHVQSSMLPRVVIRPRTEVYHACMIRRMGGRPVKPVAERLSNVRLTSAEQALVEKAALGESPSAWARRQ